MYQVFKTKEVLQTFYVQRCNFLRFVNYPTKGGKSRINQVMPTLTKNTKLDKTVVNPDIFDPFNLDTG